MVHNVDLMMTEEQQTRSRALIEQHYLPLKDRFDRLLKAAAVTDEIAIEEAYGKLTAGLRRNGVSTLEARHVCQYVYAMGKSRVPIELLQGQQAINHHDQPQGKATGGLTMATRKTKGNGTTVQAEDPFGLFVNPDAALNAASRLEATESGRHIYRPLDRPSFATFQAIQDGDDALEEQVTSAAPATRVAQVTKAPPKAAPSTERDAFDVLRERVAKNIKVAVKAQEGDKTYNRPPALSDYLREEPVLGQAIRELQSNYRYLNEAARSDMTGLISQRLQQMGAGEAARTAMMGNITRLAANKVAGATPG